MFSLKANKTPGHYEIIFNVLRKDFWGNEWESF